MNTMVEAWIDFYVFVALFLLFVFVLVKIESTRVYKAYLKPSLSSNDVASLSQFTLEATLDLRVQWLLLMVGFVTLNFIAYCLLLFIFLV